MPQNRMFVEDVYKLEGLRLVSMHHERESLRAYADSFCYGPIVHTFFLITICELWSP